MAHLVMDTLTSHELVLSIPAETIMERLPEWNANVVTAKSREQYVKAIAAFCGLELVDYQVANVQRTQNGSFIAKIYSNQWAMRQAK